MWNSSSQFRMPQNSHHSSWESGPGPEGSLIPTQGEWSGARVGTVRSVDDRLEGAVDVV